MALASLMVAFIHSELIYCFQSRRVLPRLETHIGGLSGVEQEQSLLDEGIHIVVVLEFCHW